MSCGWCRAIRLRSVCARGKDNLIVIFNSIKFTHNLKYSIVLYGAAAQMCPKFGQNANTIVLYLFAFRNIYEIFIRHANYAQKTVTDVTYPLPLSENC